MAVYNLPAATFHKADAIERRLLDRDSRDLV